MLKTSFRSALLALLAATPAAPVAAATPPNQVSVTAVVNVTYDEQTALYTYEYAFTNAGPLEVDLVLIPLLNPSDDLPSTVLDIRPPRGWMGMAQIHGEALIFGATETPDIDDSGPDDGSVPPSPYQIKPGQTLSGFSFKSPDPPDFVAFHAQGFTQPPVLGVDVEDPEDRVRPPALTDPSQSFKGSTKGPRYDENLYNGNRRPAVDHFLAFRNLTNRAVKPAPIQIDIVFDFSVDASFQTTFRAYLNNQDVTASFKTAGNIYTRLAVFEAGHPALKVGERNVLVMRVDGPVPGTNRVATDVDRVTFTVK